MYKIFTSLVVVLSPILICTDAARADTIVPPDLYVMCQAVPQRDMKTLLEPCGTYYEKKTEAVDGIIAILRENLEFKGIVDADAPRAQVLGWRATLSNYMTAFHSTSASYYAGKEYPAQLTAAMDREREALDLAIEAYAHMAWMLATASNDWYVVNDASKELELKFIQMDAFTGKDIHDEYMRLDKIRKSNYPVSSSDTSAALAAASRLQYALNAMKMAIEEMQSEYGKVLENYNWEKRKAIHGQEVASEKLKAIDDMYKGSTPSQWLDVYRAVKPDMDDFSTIYRDELDYLQGEYDKYLGENVFAFFNKYATYKPFGVVDPIDSVQRLIDWFETGSDGF